MDYKYFYRGFLYRWEITHANVAFRDDRIKIYHAVQAIFDCNDPVEQSEFCPPRWKYVGMSTIGLLTVITSEDETRIITSWKASRTE